MCRLSSRIDFELSFASEPARLAYRHPAGKPSFVPMGVATGLVNANGVGHDGLLLSAG